MVRNYQDIEYKDIEDIEEYYNQETPEGTCGGICLGVFLGCLLWAVILITLVAVIAYATSW